MASPCSRQPPQNILSKGCYFNLLSRLHILVFSLLISSHRYGYEICCSHRQHLLNVLLENLKDKSKILVNKRVHEIAETDSGVEVLTKDGDVYFGDIVIGADGVHSIVRKEMRRMAAKVSPSHPLVTEEEG